MDLDSETDLLHIAPIVDDVADQGEDAVPTVPDRVAAADPVNHPPHYVEGRYYEPIDVIEDWDLSYHLASAVKYISRAGRKSDELTDIKKAVFHLNRRIRQLEGA